MKVKMLLKEGLSAATVLLITHIILKNEYCISNLHEVILQVHRDNYWNW
jgi:hypothetical protein